MMRIILFGLAGVLAGVGGGAGVVIITARPVPATADSSAAHNENAAANAAADTVAPISAAHHAADTVAPTSAAPAADSGRAAVDRSAAATTHDSATAVRPTTAATRDTVVQPLRTAEKAPNAAGAALRDALVPVRIGRIFAAMPARDAARVMEQLDDNDVRRILGALSEKQAAAILALMPAARVAAISKATLKSASPPDESQQ